jgi:hypothetical protein
MYKYTQRNTPVRSRQAFSLHSWKEQYSLVEPVGSIERQVFLEQLNGYQLTKEALLFGISSSYVQIITPISTAFSPLPQNFRCGFH